MFDGARPAHFFQARFLHHLGQNGQLDGADLAVHLLGGLHFAVHGEKGLDGDTEEALVFLEVGQDELPVGLGQGHDFAAVQLLVHHLLVGVPDENGAAGGQGEEVGAGIGAGLRP